MATRFIDVTFDNGETYTYEGVPFDTTPEQAQERIAKDFPDLIVSSIDGSRRSEAVDTAAKAPRTSAPKGVADVLEQASSVTDAVIPGSGEFVKGAQGTYGNLRPDEEATYGRDSLRIEPMRIPEEIEAQILQQVAANKGNTSFNQEALNKIYSDFGYQATPASEEFLEAVRKGDQTGGIDYSKMDQELVSAEEKKQQEAREAFAKTREGMDGEFARAIDEGAQDNFMWSGLSRGLRDLFDVGKEELRAKYPGQSEEWYEEEMDKELIRQTRGARDYYQDRNEDIGTVKRFAGNVFGNLDPTIAIGGPGKTVLGRMLGMGAVETGLEGVGQTGEILAGVRDNYDPTNIAAAGVGGALFQGAAEGIGKIIRTRKSGQEIEAEVESQGGPLDGTPYEAPRQTPEPMMSRGIEGEEAFPGAMGLEGQAAIEGPRFTPKEAPVETPVAREEVVEEFTDSRKSEYQAIVDKEQSSWKNAPETFVIRDYDDLADPEVAARLKSEDPDGTAKGVTLEDGSVALIGKNIEGPEDVRAVLFHEALGHFGASQYFGKALDKNLEAFYNNSPSFRAKVDNWLEANPGAYTDRSDTIARAADEVLAEMSEAGKIDVKLMDRIKNIVKATLRKMGMQDVEYSEREIMTILGMMHDAVVKGKSVADNGFQVGPRFSNSNREKKSLTPEKMKTKNDIDDLLDFVGREAEGLTAGPISDAELGRMADDLGLTSSKYLKGKSIADSQVAARLRGAHQVITNTVDELSGLRERVEQEGMTPTLQASIRQKLGTLQALYARFDEDTAEVGRALRALRLVSESRQSSKAMDRFLRDADGLNLAADEDGFIRFMKHLEAVKAEGGAEAAGKFFNNARKMHWEDYAGSYIFNNMLSSPRTWAVNAGGGLMNHFIESFTLAARATLGAGYRALGGKGESTHTNELIAQQMGALAGLYNYRTITGTLQAFKRGEASGGSFSSKVGQTGTPLSSSSKLPVKALGYVVENPRRVMAATDEIWSAMFRMSELFRLAAHEVSNRPNFKGDYWEEVKALAKNPTAEMLQKSGDYSDEMLFRGKASKFTEGLASMQKPRYYDELNIKMQQDADGKWKPRSRVEKEKDSQAVRVGKFGFRLMVPFAHTLDRIAATMLRNSGPLAVLTPTIRKQLKAGGVEREAALGRIVATSAMLSYFGFMAANGDITGAGDSNYKKDFSLSAVTPPNAIRLGDEWMSYQGWDPLAGMMSAVSTAYERSDGELSLETAAGLVSGFSEAMMKSTYAESLANSMEMFQEVLEGVSSGEMTKKQATANFLAGQTANLVPAASFIRWMNQNFIDPNSRATKGDGSTADRVFNRLNAGLPMLSQDLPAKYDIFGREVKNPRQERAIETDPVILAVHEVDKSTDKVIFGAVGDTVKKDGVAGTKLSAAEHQEYQRVTGLFFYEDATTDLADPAWPSLTPAEKQEQLKFRYDEAKKYAREYLFPDPEEMEEVVAEQTSSTPLTDLLEDDED